MNLAQTLFNRRMLMCVALGFSSGLPLYLLLQLLPAWLRSEGLNLKTIAAFAFMQLPYTWKFLWAPLMDRYTLLERFGRRRSWILATQITLFGAIIALGASDPTLEIGTVAVFATLVALFSASQDIVIDAYRREILSDDELGLGNSIHVNAYRIAGLVPGSLALILADHLPWSQVFFIVALFMLPGIGFTLWSQEPASVGKPKTLLESVIEPFKEFIQRSGWQHAFWVLLFILLYKLGDSMATALATPFYLDMGFSKTDIGAIAKGSGLVMQIIGALVGGLWMLKLGINRGLWVFGVVQALSILGFAWLAHSGPFASIDVAERGMLAFVIGFEAFGVGLGTVAYVAYMARETNPAYTATQLALFTSLSAVPRSVFNALTGGMVETLGWEQFFYVCTLLAIPGMLLLFKVAGWRAR
ncbi:AmpG family muropeptide MFS transporter [Methylophilus medardicus]|uniref:AmpG family muropeptide MFS transporter n=1 Tax=Methylophilus medardicus TaxID=2588534 RepID=A0A5B8CVR7_9PROT|nr:AmpG family muropeptide MFS transporter [Methylophilus medardicus]QDC45186.1 AmpG family muropeptide MFS transporter [Methylophilus medardicus]QDC50193.1 AmpG family muropeptide MFS transporter [Methylophilus medardicus]QDC53898.1 AmpG family muropeptide MFS transporter [Methylophilus medardicus]